MIAFLIVSIAHISQVNADNQHAVSSNITIYGFEPLEPPQFYIHIGNQYSNIRSINPMGFAIGLEHNYGSFVGGVFVYSAIVNKWILLREYTSKIHFLNQQNYQ